MRRRRMLAVLVGTTGAYAGCLGRSAVPATDGGRDGGGDGGNDRTPTPTGAPSRGCPEYDRVRRVVCYDDADLDAVDAFLEPSTRTIEPGGLVEFTLRNRGDRTLQTNFYNWNVHKHVDGEWHHVAPRGWNEPLMGVPPGEQHTWRATFENDSIEAGAPVPLAGGTEDLTVAGVGGGHYAFRARGWFAGDDHEQAVAFAATFDLDAEPLALTPTNAVEDSEWEGDTLVARSTRRDPDDEHTRLGAYELERVDGPGEEPRKVIVEQAVRNDQLRDALALALVHGADRVRLEEYDSSTPIFGAYSDGLFEFQGSYYEVTTRELEDA